MSHSQFRQGSYFSLSHDFVFVAVLTQEQRLENVDDKYRQFQALGQSYSAVNLPEMACRQHLAYESREKTTSLLRDLAAAELGLSITVSGLLDQVRECCLEVGLTPHTLNASLGLWGNRQKLPPEPVLSLTTMCGHSRVHPTLVIHLAQRVRARAMTVAEATKAMGLLCVCNIFNQVRGGELLNQLVSLMESGLFTPPPPPSVEPPSRPKAEGITIDQVECNGCLECLPYCPNSAIVELPGKGVVGINAEHCIECAICYQSKVCPVDAIQPQPLSYPRTLRGKCSGNRYSPYWRAAMDARHIQPRQGTREPGFGDRELSILSGGAHGDKTNDVTGRYKPGQATISVELGRPFGTTSFPDVEKVAKALKPFGLPPGENLMGSLSPLLADREEVRLREDILRERIGRFSIGVTVADKKAPQVLAALRQVSGEMDSVFACNLISPIDRSGSVPAIDLCREAGFDIQIAGKTTVGLGRPLVRFF